MDLLQHHCIAARANRMANRRLHAAMAKLTRDDFHAPRTGFFPSLALTMNHILAVDVYYLDALEGVADMVARYDQFVAADTLQELAYRQRLCDERLIMVCDRLDAEAIDPVIVMDRGQGRQQRDRAGHVLAHLFMHQTHHRGQVHAMLSGTHIKPPQLDEFLMPSDAPYRVEDMRELGWNEESVYGA
ncbi:DinB family protein [Ideonella sp. BN130291]|uniref:DinB family protein n=1 Tax=Ideonella sp. BN130291 TaxID=3112940 RepID=UPI002E269CC1|nr:DinB family protein [Ideonella sp. BN130291]